MTIQKNTWLKAGLTLSAAGLMMLTNNTEASANGNWVPRTVLEIEEDINEAKDDIENDNETLEYTFQWGDTLWGVSQATDISVDKLVQVNDIDNRSLIHVGTTIYLSKDLSVVSVQNEEEVVSYDVSDDEVKETETPKEVEEAAEQAAAEKAEAEKAAAEKAAADKAAAEKAAEEEAAAEKAAEAKASTSSNNTAEAAGRWMSVEATAYSRNQESLSNFTFMGIDLRENSRVIAVDPNVIPLGSKIFVPGYGEYIAGDTGGAIKGNRIDLHMEDLDAAWQFGRRQIDIKILE